MDNSHKVKIQQILNAFETGSAEGDYGNISVFKDAPGNQFQYTVGRSQTTESGMLKEMLLKYVSNNGAYAKEVKHFADRIQPHNGRGPYIKSIYKNADFERTIKQAASDPIMRRTQDEFFDSAYWVPAYKFFRENGFTTPLSMLVIYDTAIHSGPALSSPKSMMTILRGRFKEKPPVSGGNEKVWIAQYVNARHDWLANHTSRPVLRKTVYRTRTFKKLIDENNWNLVGNINANGVTIRDSTPSKQSVDSKNPVTVQPTAKPDSVFTRLSSWIKSWF